MAQLTKIDGEWCNVCYSKNQEAYYVVLPGPDPHHVPVPGNPTTGLAVTRKRAINDARNELRKRKGAA